MTQDVYLERMAQELTMLRQRVAALEIRENPRQPINQINCDFVIAPNHVYVIDVADLGTNGVIDFQANAVLILA